MSTVYSNSLPVCQVCNLKSFGDVPVAELKGTVIKDNLQISDELERNRENEKRRRDAILAEQGLREGGGTGGRISLGARQSRDWEEGGGGPRV